MTGRGRQPGRRQPSGCAALLFLAPFWLGPPVLCLWGAVDQWGTSWGSPGPMLCAAAVWLIGPFVIASMSRRR